MFATVRRSSVQYARFVIDTFFDSLNATIKMTMTTTSLSATVPLLYADHFVASS